MRSLAVINQKGGVGKTTTSVNLAAALVRKGRRVLLIDLDPQSHATLHVGVELGEGERGIYDVLAGGAAMAEVVRYVDERLAIAPSSLDLAGAELEIATHADRQLALASALRPYHEHFDWLIIDCAPSLGLLTINALSAVHEVLIPLQPHFLALQGLGRLLQTIAAVRDELQPDLRVAGVLFAMAENTTRLAQEVYADVERFIAEAQPSDPWKGAIVFRTRIRRNIKLAECPSFGRTIFDYAPGSHGAEDYAALADEVLQLPAPAAAARAMAAPLEVQEPQAAAAAAS